MDWNGNTVRQLRQRLAWSQAELARRLGCTLEALSQWELNNIAPFEDVTEHLNVLQRHLDSHCDRLARGPVAEALMAYLNLTQIHSDDVEAKVGENSQIFVKQN